MAHRRNTESRRFLIRALAVASTVGLLLTMGVIASADSPNPDPTAGITGSGHRNADGTVTVTVHGQWKWKASGTNCLAGWAAAWNDDAVHGNVIGDAKKGTMEVGVLAPGNSLNAADNTLYHGAAGSCVSGPWGPLSHTYSAQQQTFNVCVVTYHVKGTNPTAGGATRDKDNSFEENNYSLPAGSCMNIPVDSIDPSISLTKSVSKTLVKAGDPVDYTYVVTNTGNVNLHDVVVTDNLLGTIGTVPGTLAPGASATLHANGIHIFGQTSNIGSTEGKDPLNHKVGPATDIARVDVSPPEHVDKPAISIVKTATPGTVEPGQTVTFSYLVTNIGNVALDNVTVTDDVLGVIGTINHLDVGQSTTLTKPQQIAAGSPRTNVGTACGFAGSDKVCDSSKATIAIVLGELPSRAPAATPVSATPHQTG